MLIFRKIFTLVYDETTTTAATTPAATVTTPAQTEVTTTTTETTDPDNLLSGTQGNGTGSATQFSKEQQEFINRRWGEERRRMKEQNEKTVRELEALKKQSGLTEKQKGDLQKRIDELNQQFMSKEEIHKQEIEKKQKEHQTQLHTVSTERDGWQKRFYESTAVRALQDAAIVHEAFNPAQIITLLQGNTRIIEVLDSEGKPTGTFEPRVKFQDKDSEGKDVILDLSVDQAVKRMKDLPEKYGNLFKSGVIGGLGGTGSQNGSGRVTDWSRVSTADYMARRQKGQTPAGKTK